MIAILIIFLLIIVFLAFFVGKNLLNVCTIWFFKDFTNLSVAMLVFIAFGSGILFSILLMFFSRMKKFFGKNDDEKESSEYKKNARIKRAEEKSMVEKLKKEKLERKKLAKENALQKKIAKISKKDMNLSTNKADGAVVAEKNASEIATEKSESQAEKNDADL